MHPLLRRFLDVQKVIDVIERPTDDDARALVKALSQDGTLTPQLLASKGKSASNDLQQRVIVAATKAAAERLSSDGRLGPKAKAGVEAVVAAGGSEDEGRALVQQAVLDEAFGWVDDPEEFDENFLAETLDSIVPLATVDADAVEAWVDEFVKRAEAPKRPLRLASAEALLEAAWGDGPIPIAAEHVDDAMETLARSVASAELERAGQALSEFLAYLGEKRLLGPTRLARLTDIARASARSPELGEDEEDESDEEE
jgi:hypothetical protein